MKPAPSARKPVLVLGGGLAGLSAAYHLKSPYTLIEREPVVGGTARSLRCSGFTFDYTGHLLHLHHPYTKRLIRKILRGNFFRCRRNTSIFSQGRHTPYPFQANTFGLPEKVIDECVLGFFTAFLTRACRRRKITNFQDWCLQTFGAGISQYFMIPYNEKLYRTPTRRMAIDWCGPFVPTPDLADVVRGALKKNNVGFGYNQDFLYPKRGGIQALADGLAEKVGDIRLALSVEKIDWRKRQVTLSNGLVLPYSQMINTLPLPELLKKMEHLPHGIRRIAKTLKFVSVLCVNMGVGRARISDKSWIYFPEKHFPFYRVGFPMNFTPHVVPKNHSSMYIEIALKPGERYSKSELIRKTILGLRRCGILRPGDRLPVIQILPIKYAYVVYDHERKKALAKITPFLKKHGIFSIGRYGAWKYSFMEEAILDGKKAADTVERKTN